MTPPTKPQVLAHATLALMLSLACLSSGCKREAPAAFDLPTAMGADFHADIDALGARLGPPSGSGVDERGLATRMWQKDGARLTAAYKTGSKRVVSLAIIARPDAEAVSDEGKLKLLRVAKLPENEAGGAYSVEWIEASERPTFSVGFRVVPAPRTHKVALRITGTAAILTVGFQPTTTLRPESPEASGSFETLPPWQTSFEAPDDAKLVLQSRIRQNMDPSGAFSMRAQIEVDGRVVRDQESTGARISLDYEL